MMRKRLPIATGGVTRRQMLRVLAAGAGWTLVGGNGIAGRGRAIALAKQDVLTRTEKSGLIVHEREPLNAEPSLPELTEDWITPTEHFYVRNHGNIPKLDADTFRLTIDGLVDNPLEFSLDYLKERFPGVSVTATMTCAGNRRDEFTKKAEGVQWQAGAIGNADWKGTRLSEILRAAGIKEGAKHIWFEGLDDIPHQGRTITFGGSIPIETAMSQGDSEPVSLLAWEMNGEPLSPEHGFPLRTVVPSYIGARSVKWLGRIRVSDRPSQNHYLKDAYKLVTETTERQWRAASPIYEFPLNAAGTRIPADDGTQTGKAALRGYALAPGIAGRTITRVELSTDEGESWSPANLSSKKKPFCWELWTASVPITPHTERILVRAVDSAGDVQPQDVAWNAKGYLYNGYYAIPL